VRNDDARRVSSCNTLPISRVWTLRSAQRLRPHLFSSIPNNLANRSRAATVSNQSSEVPFRSPLRAARPWPGPAVRSPSLAAVNDDLSELIASSWSAATADLDTHYDLHRHRSDCLRTTLADLIPDPDEWAILPPATADRIVLLAATRLYVLAPAPTEEGFSAEVACYDLDQAQVGLTERIEFSHGARFRHRTWVLRAADGLEIEILSEQNLSSSAEPPQEERLARQIAASVGWELV
jgi:hypothetical protein